MYVFVMAKVMKIKDFTNLRQTMSIVDDKTGEMIFDESTSLATYSIKLASNKSYNNISYDVYNSHYDHKRNLKGFSNDGHNFTSFYQRKDFKTFVIKESEDIAFMNINTSNGNSYIKKLNKNSDKGIVLEKITIDFERIIKNAKNVTGAVISHLNKTNITSQSLYGSDITSTPTYRDLKSQGKLSSITIEFLHRKSNLLILISKKGSIVLYSTEIKEEILIELLHSFYIKLLK